MRPLTKILLADDEVCLLSLLEGYLGRLGYEVTACSSAPEAWARFESQAADFSVVVLDMRMPDMSGQELAGRMLEMNPALRLVLSSGYPFDISQIPVRDPAQIEFLQKPYSPSMLAKVIERLLKPRPEA